MTDSPVRQVGGSRRDLPLPNCNFHVEVDGVATSGFAVVDVDPMRVSVIRYRDGSDLGERAFVGRPEPCVLTLTRGVTGDQALYRWWRQTRDGEPQRTTITVMVLDEHREPVLRWVFRSAWPVSYTLGTLDADGDSALSETVEVAFCEMEME
jgi:phage tail-like protein